MQSYRQSSYIALDVEMTGLKVKEDRVIEIGAIKVIDEKVVSTFSTLINPNKKLDEKVAHLTGIKDKDLKAAPYINEILSDFIEFCADLPILGHNITFDFAFIKKEAVNLGLKFEKNGIDTLKISRKLLPDDIKKNLSSLCEYFNIKVEREHRAYDDAKAAHELYQKFCNLNINEEILAPKALNFNIKKEKTASRGQKERLHKLLNYHKIKFDIDINLLTQNEISRIADKIIADYGRMENR